MQAKKLVKILLALTLMAVLFVGAFTRPNRWWLRVGGIRGEKIHVRSEIDGAVQETNTTIPSTLSASVKSRAIDYWITKTVTNEDLWVSVRGPARTQNYYAWWKDQAGVRISIRNGRASVWKIGYRNPREEAGGSAR